ncbi:MAG: hypothetical protein V1889_02820 [archaeon]
MGIGELDKAERVAGFRPADCHEADEVAEGLVSSLIKRFNSGHLSTEQVVCQLRATGFEKIEEGRLMGGESRDVNPNFYGLFRKGDMRVEVYESCLFDFTTKMNIGEPFAKVVVRGPAYCGHFSFN